MAEELANILGILVP